MRLPENVELIVIETTVLNAVHFQNYGTHNFLHPERTCSTAHFKKKKSTQIRPTAQSSKPNILCVRARGIQKYMLMF